MTRTRSQANPVQMEDVHSDEEERENVPPAPRMPAQQQQMHDAFPIPLRHLSTNTRSTSMTAMMTEMMQ